MGVLVAGSATFKQLVRLTRKSHEWLALWLSQWLSPVQVDGKENWLGGLLVLACFVGCKALQPEDPLSAYSLPGEVDPDRGMFTDFADGLVATARSSVGLGLNEDAARQLYSESMSVYQNAAKLEGGQRIREFERAAKGFDKAAKRWPKSSVEEDAKFYQAESLFFADKYPAAESEFSTLLSEYQSSRHVDAVSRRRFQIAQYWLDHHEAKGELPIVPNFTSRDRPTFDKFGNAIKILEGIRLDDPTGELADDATMMAALATFKVGKYYRADELLTDLRTIVSEQQASVRRSHAWAAVQDPTLPGTQLRFRTAGRCGRVGATDATPVSN